MIINNNIIMMIWWIWSVGVFAVSGASTASLRLYGYSLRFGPGTSAEGLYQLEVSTLDWSSPPNGEVAPSFSQPDHVTGFRMNDPNGILSLSGVMAFDVPASDDINANGFYDFFEVSQAASGTTTGLYSTSIDQGTVRASWSRPAQSRIGTCVLRLTSETFGQLPDFTHTFELLEYTGTLSYLAGTNGVRGTVSLVQTGVPDNCWEGPIQFLRSPTNRFNELQIQAGLWTNGVNQSLSYSNSVVWRDDWVGTNYYGYFDFQDGEPGTPESDFVTWGVSIDDPNDNDGDGIPDLSDDLPPEETGVSLSLVRAGSALVLEIQGTAGRTYELQSCESLPATHWQIMSTISLTNAIQQIRLSWPSVATRFWRLRGL